MRATVTAGVAFGSSPRVRGKAARRRSAPCRGRLIPARAGKTPSPPSSRTRARAHPRACGENLDQAVADASPYGSSPRVRGKRTEDLGGDHPGGLIPARAGKTCSDSTWSRLPGAHPRACGENSIEDARCMSGSGSSPRVRGKLRARRHPQRRAGLIPARAGKTSTSAAALVCSAAHPRACGENCSKITTDVETRGSSPRVRGKQAQVHAGHQRLRLIPARAGKTSSQPPVQRTPPAHPRACGEN